MNKFVVNCKKEKYDIYIGRPSIFGNPFIIGPDGTREEVVKKYKNYILNNPELLQEVPKLKDKVLGCFCSPEACHGDILAELANQKDVINLSWQEIEECVEILKKQILEKNIEFEGIVALNRGGLIPGVLLSHRLDIKHSVITIERYKDKTKLEQIKIDEAISTLANLNTKSNLLIVDDICDGGESLVVAIDRFKRFGYKKYQIFTATLFYKKQAITKPSFYSKEINDKIWVNFPWER